MVVDVARLAGSSPPERSASFRFVRREAVVVHIVLVVFDLLGSSSLSDSAVIFRLLVGLDLCVNSVVSSWVVSLRFLFVPLGFKGSGACAGVSFAF